MKVRITNKGRSPRGIHDSSGHRIVTIAPKETREMDLSEAQIMRYRAKIAGGDTLELVEPLGAGAAEYKPVPEKAEKAAKAEKPAKEPKAAKTKAEKPKAEKAPAETAPATDSKEALQAEAAKLGIPGYQNFGTKRLRREIAAKKAELAEAGDSE